MIFTLRGKIIPYVRMTRKGKWVSERAQAYLASQRALAWQIRLQMVENGWEALPSQTPLYFSWQVMLTERLHGKDFDNLIKALVDAAQGVAFVNDAWIDVDLGGKKYLGLGDEDRAIIEIGVLE